MTASLSELVRPDRVHRSLYTDPSIFTAEMTTLFGATWTYLAHESEIPEPDDYVRRRLGLRPTIVTRGSDGVVRVLMNRCTHRAATVCRDDAGSARSFTCPYHGWTFANTGRLTGVPIPGAYGKDLDRGALSLGQARCETYRGFVFATLNPHERPLAERLGPAAGVIDQWIDRAPGGTVRLRHGTHRMVFHGNWKLVYDNSADGYHPGFSHRSLLTMRKDRYGSGVDMQYSLVDVDAGPMATTDLGNGNTFFDQRPEIPKYWPQAAPSPGREAYEQILRERLGDEAAEQVLEVAVGSGMNLNIFPNLLVIGNQLQVIEPLAVDRTQLTWYATEAEDTPPEITSIRMRLQEDFPQFGEVDDLVNFEECQAGLAIPEVEWVMIDRHLTTGLQTINPDGTVTGPASDEIALRAFWRRWSELMTAPAALAAPPAGTEAARAFLEGSAR